MLPTPNMKGRADGYPRGPRRHRDDGAHARPADAHRRGVRGDRWADRRRGGGRRHSGPGRTAHRGARRRSDRRPGGGSRTRRRPHPSRPGRYSGGVRAHSCTHGLSRHRARQGARAGRGARPRRVGRRRYRRQSYHRRALREAGDRAARRGRLRPGGGLADEPCTTGG